MADSNFQLKPCYDLVMGGNIYIFSYLIVETPAEYYLIEHWDPSMFLLSQSSIDWVSRSPKSDSNIKARYILLFQQTLSAQSRLEYSKKFYQFPDSSFIFTRQQTEDLEK